jgi:hypothetical protein
MQCNCGREMKQWSYQTKDKLIHEIQQCPSCGRRYEQIRNEKRELIGVKG